jgi:hypothetical protein
MSFPGLSYIKEVAKGLWPDDLSSLRSAAPRLAACVAIYEPWIEYVHYPNIDDAFVHQGLASLQCGKINVLTNILVRKLLRLTVGKK